MKNNATDNCIAKPGCPLTQGVWGLHDWLLSCTIVLLLRTDIQAVNAVQSVSVGYRLLAQQKANPVGVAAKCKLGHVYILFYSVLSCNCI